MKEQELQELIDKSVGTKGPLKMHSFWMHKILNEFLSFIKESIKTINTNISNISKDINNISKDINNTINDPVFGKTVVNTITATASDFTCNLYPNEYLKLNSTGNLQNIYIRCNDPIDNVVNEYLLEITTGNNVVYIQNYYEFKWVNDDLRNLEPNTTYQISIIDNLAVIGKFVEMQE